MKSDRTSLPRSMLWRSRPTDTPSASAFRASSSRAPATAGGGRGGGGGGGGGTGRGTILIKIGKGDRVLGFVAAGKKDAEITVTTNRGASKNISASRYGVTSRAGRGRELMKNGTLTAIDRPEGAAPPPAQGTE